MTSGLNRHTAVDLLDRLHRAQNEFYSGGSSTPLEVLLLPDIVWAIPGENLIAGTYRGLEEVFGYFRLRRDLAHGSFQIKRLDVLVGDGDRIAALTDGTATIGGTTRHWSTVGLYQIAAERIAACWLLPLDQRAFDQAWGWPTGTIAPPHDRHGHEPANETMTGATTRPDRTDAAGVQTMFDRISRVYDPLNAVMTLGIHRRWTSRAVDLAQLAPGARVLDVATGTGDLAIALAQRVAPGGEVIGVDFSEKMLELARIKAPALRFDLGDALALPYANAEFDAATCAYGVRNFADIDQGLREIARVVRTGGAIVLVEFAIPRRRPFSTFYRAWFDHFVPTIGRLAGDADAYQYLPESVRRFPTPEDLAARMTISGMSNIRYRITAGGIVTFHTANIPVTRAT